MPSTSSGRTAILDWLPRATLLQRFRTTRHVLISRSRRLSRLALALSRDITELLRETEVGERERSGDGDGGGRRREATGDGKLDRQIARRSHELSSDEKVLHERH